MRHTQRKPNTKLKTCEVQELPSRHCLPWGDHTWNLVSSCGPSVPAGQGTAAESPAQPPRCWREWSISRAPDEAALVALAETLKQHDIDHEVWTEQPENVATCLALRPYPKERVHQHLKKFKLLK
nr:putative peptidyl-tRNA hydrolase PTRHD1 [Columba livia]